MAADYDLDALVSAREQVAEIFRLCQDQNETVLQEALARFVCNAAQDAVEETVKEIRLRVEIMLQNKADMKE
jgi:hypothetical protein